MAIVAVVIALKTIKRNTMKSKKNYLSFSTNTILSAGLLLALSTASNYIFAQDSVAVSTTTEEGSLITSKEGKKNTLFEKDCLCTDDSLFNEVQFSVIPGISTCSYTRNPKNVYDFSFNLIMGKVYSVRYLELGLILNADESDVSYVQGAGIGNLVGGTVTGVQSAGIFNLTGCVTGVQHAGIINRVKGSFVGVQHAGVANVVTRSFKGAQFGGILNYSDSLIGYQSAGVFNRASYVKGLQVSGVLNRTKNSKGAQLSGVINLADTITGVQIAGVVNRAKTVNGFQLGLVNIADTIDGACLGLVNVIRNGYHRWEVAGDEVFYTNVAYRSGVQKLHTILSVGMIPDKFDSPTWTIGAGLGMSFGRPNKTLLDIDLATQQVIERDRFKNNHLLHKVYVGIDQPISSKLSLAFGVTYNFFFYTKGEENRISEIMPKSFSRESHSGNTLMNGWVGGKVALRFR